jgi:hypothetical protein
MFTPIKQSEIAVSGTANTVKTLDGSQSLTYRLYSTVDCVVLIGNTSTAADRTVTSGSYAGKNIVLPAGSIETFMIQSNGSENYVSAIALDGSSTGKLYVTTGVGE